MTWPAVTWPAVDLDAAWHAAVAVAYVVFAAWASGHALLNKRDPRAAFGWIGVCWLMPFAGAILYVLFGINRVEVRGRRLHGLARPRATELPGHHSGLPLTQLQRIGGAVSGQPLLGGNRVSPLRNGDVAFPEMLAAIEVAHESIWLVSYIFDTGGACRPFLTALRAAVERGVVVKVLVDGVGQWYSVPHPVGRLRRAGVDAGRFLPPRLLPPSLFLNLRNHRKLLVVDGEVAFAGGMNIANRYLRKNVHRRTSDMHFRIEGPVVRQLASAFARDWYFVTQEKLPLRQTPPPVADAHCRVVVDGPVDSIDRLTMIMLGAVSAAHQRVRIMTPYFLPPRELAAALQAAALRGVEVEVILPRRSNLRVVDWASRHALQDLLEYGVRLYLEPAPFDHSKLLMVDGVYALIGSANVDPRSLRLNFELGVEVFDASLCSALDAVFEAARGRSRSVDARLNAARRLPARVRDGLAWLFSPYL